MNCTNVLVLVLTLLLLILFGGCFCYTTDYFGNYNGTQELKRKIPSSARALKANPKLVARSHNPNVNRFIAKEVYLDRKEPSPEVYAHTERFHKAFMDNEAERHSELTKLYNELGNPEVVIILFFCKKYFKFFKNWVLSCEKAGIKVRDKVITFALDQEAKQLANDYGFKSFVLDQRYEKAGNSSKFGDREFAATMFYKNALIYDMLRIIPDNKYLLFQDSDLIWFNDPIPYLTKESKTNGYDMQIMYDGPNYNYKNIYANSGFIFLKSNDVTRALFETALRNSAFIFSGGSHQRPLEKIFEHFVLHNMLDMRVLDEYKFLNGHLFKTTGGIDKNVPKDWKNSSYVWHYSWTLGGEEKLEKLDKYELNFVD
jgi:hypothetical protein